MTRAFGFDGDSAYQESLEASVRASEAKRREEAENAQRERRKSLGLPEDEHKSHSTKKAEKNADPARKKSIGEKISNFVFNAGRSSKAQTWGEERVGLESGRVVRDKRKEDKEEGSGLGGGTEKVMGIRGHGEARVVQ